MEDLTSTLSALAISTKTPIQRCVEALIAEIAKTSPTQETARTLIREITTTLETAFCKEPLITTAATAAATNSTAATAAKAPVVTTTVATNSTAATAATNSAAVATNSAAAATAVATNSTAAATTVATNSAAATVAPTTATVAPTPATNSAAAFPSAELTGRLLLPPPALREGAAVSSTLSILPAAPPKKSRGGASLKKGTAYEDVIRELLAKYTYNELVIDVAGKTAGAGHGQDVQFIVADITVNVECKDKGAFEGGGKTYKNVENTLVFPEECLHKTLLEGYIPFGGRVPSFLKGDKTLATWETEKTMFKDEHTNVPDTTVADYYRSKGIHYIQFEKKGLYTTGYDILELGVPLFKCETRIRIRCKRHGSSTMPGSVQAAFVYTKKSIIPSPVDFQKKLPIKFKKAAI